MLNSIFDKVFLINLDRRPDRLAICDDWLKKHEICYERIVAVDGADLEGGASRKNSETGCKLSHFGAIQKILDNNYINTLILEDDFDPVVDFKEKFAEAAKWVPNEWHQLYFGGNHQNPLKPINDFVSKTTGTATTHAYALRREVCPAVMQFYDHPETIDGIYRIAQLSINSYTFMPHLINQKQGYSDIVGMQVNYDFMR